MKASAEGPRSSLFLHFFTAQYKRIQKFHAVHWMPVNVTQRVNILLTSYRGTTSTTNMAVDSNL